MGCTQDGKWLSSPSVLELYEHMSSNMYLESSILGKMVTFWSQCDTFFNLGKILHFTQDGFCDLLGC